MHGGFIVSPLSVTVLACFFGTLSWQDNGTCVNLSKIPSWFFTPNICRREDDFRYEEITQDNRLVRLNGIQVGHVQDLQLFDGRIHQVVTRSLRPLLFEIPEFLSPEECDHLIQIAQREHFEESETVYGKGNGSDREVFEKKMAAGRDLAREKITFCSTLLRSYYDIDKNGRINLQELIRYIDEEKYIYPMITDAMPIFRLLDLDLDEAIDREECFNLSNSDFVEFLYQIEKLRSLPRYFIRFSDSTWIRTNKSGIPFVKRLQERIVKLTGLSKHLVESSEPIQIVRYSVFGHYNVHYDSTDDIRGRKECCQGSDYSNCHMCRFVTIILYLNNVAKGGETAFPVADDPERYASRNFSITLSERCHEASLVIKPKKGTAIMWYNHFLEYDGADHMTAIDRLTLHGGCDVIKGVKWIANVWLNAPWKKGGEI